MIVGSENSNMIKWGLFLSSVCVLLASCSNDLDEVKRLSDDVVLPVSTTSNVEMTYSDSARLRAKVKAPLRESYLGTDARIEFNKGVRVEFYNSAGKIESKMRAERAISFNKEDKMEAWNHVVVENTAGDILETEHLIWDQATNRIYSEEYTRITSPDKVIYGDGFESNQDFSRYRILKVRGIIDMKE